MKKQFFAFIFFLVSVVCFSQTKVGGYIFDEYNEPVAFASIIFKGSQVGTVSDENGKFYLQAERNYASIQVAFMGYKTYTYQLSKRNTFNIEIILKSDNEALQEVMVFSGKTSKKK
jgi:hypothetical protein